MSIAQHRPYAEPVALPALALLLNALVWGLSWIALKALKAHGVHPLWSTVMIYGSILLLLTVSRPSGWRALPRHPYLLLLAAAAGMTNLGFNWAVTIGDVVRVILLFYLMPAWSIGVAWWLLGERPTRAALARVALALAGVLLVLKKPGSPWPVPESLSDGLAIMAGFTFALTNTLLRRWRAVPGDARAMSMFGGSMAIALVAASLGTLNGLIPEVPAISSQWLPWAVALGAAFLCGNLALQYGAARLPAQATALIMLSEVVFASLSAVWLGATQLSPETLFGGLMILAAALLAVLDRRQ